MSDAEPAGPAARAPERVSATARARLWLLLGILILLIGIVLLGDYLGRATPMRVLTDGLLRRAADLFAVGLLLLSALALGERTLKLLATPLDSPVFRTVIRLGLGLLWFYVFGIVLSLVQAVTPASLWLTTIAPILVLHRDLRAALRDARSAVPRALPLDPPLIALAALLGLYGLVALCPPYDVDPLTYHLVVPRDYLAHGGATRDFDNAFHSAPPAMAMLYLYVMGMGSDLMPKLLHSGFLWLTLALCYDRFRAHGSQWLAAYAVLLFAAQWSVQHAVLRANVDLHFTFYAIASFLVLLPVLGAADKPLDTRHAVLAGILIGGAAASKVQSILSVVGTEAVLAVLLLQKRASLRAIAGFHVAALAVYLPTLLRNLVYSIDPLLLTLASAVGVDLGVDPQEALRLQLFAEWKRLFQIEMNPVTVVLTPLLAYLDGAFPTTNFDAYIDPLYLITLPLGALFIRRERAIGYIYLYLGAFYLAWLATAALTRYAFPALVLLAFLTAFVFDRVSERAGERYGPVVRRALGGIVIGFAAISALGFALSHPVHIGYGASAFVERLPRVQFLQAVGSHAVDTLLAATYMNERDVEREGRVDPQNARVFMVFDSQGYYLGRRYYNDPWYVNLLLLRRAQQRGQDPIDWLRRGQYRYVLYDPTRVPWIRNSRRQNPLLNPYPDALARFESMLQYWERDVAPRLVTAKKLPRRVLYEVPPGPTAAR